MHPPDMEPADLSLVEAGAAIAGGRLSARDLAEATIARAEASAHLHALTCWRPEKLRAEARAADARCRAGLPLGPFEGVPIVVKDNIATPGMPTSGGTGALCGREARTAAPAALRLLAAGAILAAKSNLHELAYGITSNNALFGAVGNPWGLGLIAGGSSGGTAAAVAARVFAAGLGTDTGGSVRIPAALCGIIGFRPSVGRYPGQGVLPLSPTRDTIGPMARSIEDILWIDALMGGLRAPPAPSGRRPRELRLGVPRRDLWDDLDPALSASCETALAVLGRAGVHLVDIDMPGMLEAATRAGFPITLHETSSVLPGWIAREHVGIDMDALIAGIASPDVRAILQGLTGPDAVPRAAYRHAMTHERPAMRAAFVNLLADQALDGVIFPTTPLPAAPIGADETVILNGRDVPTFETFIRNTAWGSIIGAPGLSLPAGLASGLPVGLEIEGAPGADAALLDTGRIIAGILGPLGLPDGAIAPPKVSMAAVERSG